MYRGQDDIDEPPPSTATRTTATTVPDGFASGGVLVASSDLEEVLRIADRVLVMHDGTVAGELGRGEMTEERIMELATGGGGEG